VTAYQRQTQVVESGISLSEYVILGLGGKEFSVLHARHTAKALNEINPQFIRVRTLIINEKVPLSAEIAAGKFIRATDEDIVREERILIENLDVQSRYISDHVSNLLPQLEGDLPGEKESLLAVLDEFEALPPPESQFYGQEKVGLYKTIKDMSNDRGMICMEQIKFKLLATRNSKPEIIFH
jgi:hypothetical protein